MAALARAAAALMLAALALLIAAPAHALDLANNRNLTTFLFPLPGEYWVFGAENSVVWLSVDIPTDLYLTNPFVEAFVSPVLLSSNSPPQWMSIEIPKNNSIVSRAPPASGYTLFLTAAGVGVETRQSSSVVVETRSRASAPAAAVGPQRRCASPSINLHQLATRPAFSCDSWRVNIALSLSLTLSHHNAPTTTLVTPRPAARRGAELDLVRWQRRQRRQLERRRQGNSDAPAPTNNGNGGGNGSGNGNSTNAPSPSGNITLSPNATVSLNGTAFPSPTNGTSGNHTSAPSSTSSAISTINTTLPVPGKTSNGVAITWPGASDYWVQSGRSVVLWNWDTGAGAPDPATPVTFLLVNRDLAISRNSFGIYTLPGGNGSMSAGVPNSAQAAAGWMVMMVDEKDLSHVYATSQYFEIKFRGFAEKLPPPYDAKPKSDGAPRFSGAAAVVGAAVALLAAVAAVA
ncbi:hypothetical protein Q8F55_006602 [Vanrija albida]|uniref:Uncharacterized protein n=1 Tax=Vanrija albida TaxID=181172 RepID=A0ABR3PXN0_9TREE